MNTRTVAGGVVAEIGVIEKGLTPSLCVIVTTTGTVSAEGNVTANATVVIETGRTETETEIGDANVKMLTMHPVNVSKGRKTSM